MREPTAVLINYRCERARETLAEAKHMAAGGWWNACVNRLYYACFYAVSALLLQHNFSSSKHKGILALFNLHYVNTGRISKEQGRIYHRLYERRHQGDYMDLIRFSKEEVEPWIKEAIDFVENVLSLLEGTQ